MLVKILLSLVSALLFKTIAAYSNGKIRNACQSMNPEHGYSSSTDPPPYKLTVNSSKFSSGDQIQVNLSGAVFFEGFLLEARDFGNPKGGPVGTFTLVDSAKSQLLKCGQGSAVSHTSAGRKMEMQALWNAPENSPPIVSFLVTVVQHYHIYWERIPGPVISQSGVAPSPPNPTVFTDGGHATPSPLPPQPFSSEGCGKTKSCFRDPAACVPAGNSACFFLSFTVEGEAVLFELSGPADGYLSFALSMDKWMGNDDVYMCVRDGERVEVSAAYLRGRTHPENITQSALRDVAWSWSGGVIKCRFRRGIYTPQSPSRFLLNESHYLFLAHGPANNGKIHRHDCQPFISTNQKVISGEPEDLTGSRSPMIMKFHGSLMLIAWMTSVSAGVMIARYCRDEWPDSALFGQTVWFQVHRALMIFTVSLTFLGSILPFVYRGGWSRRAGAHPYLGCVVMTLAFLQPIMAVVRPPPDSERRWMFNWLHLSVGTVAEVIAVLAMFLGIRQQALRLPEPGSTTVLAGSIVWGVAARLLLEFHSRGLLKIGTSTSTDQEAILSSQPSQCVRDHEGSQFRKVVLTVFLCGNIGFLSALLHTINNM
ncbi:putative ferric-chelate reductase 1 isoform X1 [Brienomyrus brachyistius]|uniref:putative ferric-chelate reductase 1 isoform X1 n=1 Tax=Brienomyrus brachyistius TaxID=42636 RepID=UPI0020B39DD5|nr:putative ferric-chelate reductase 1 isoform X1 [Brienomyrus brachyistius]